MKTPDVRAAVLGFLLEGNTETDIKEWIAAQGEEPDRLYQDAIRQLLTTHERGREFNRAFALEGLREMYRRLVEIGDYAAAAKVLVDFNKLHLGR